MIPETTEDKDSPKPEPIRRPGPSRFVIPAGHRIAEDADLSIPAASFLSREKICGKITIPRLVTHSQHFVFSVTCKRDQEARAGNTKGGSITFHQYWAKIRQQSYIRSTPCYVLTRKCIVEHFLRF